MGTRPGSILTLCLLMLAGCAGQPPLDRTGIDPSLTPAIATSGTDTNGTPLILWGGLLIASNNMKQYTQLVILAYPLNDSGRPLTDRPPTGRFIAQQKGYHELASLPVGRLVSVRGRLTEIVDGLVGESPYRYPRIEVEQWHLWPDYTPQPSPQFHFGVGVLFD